MNYFDQPYFNKITPTDVDTTVALWDNLYLCSFSQLATTSVEYLKLMGTMTTGDLAVDREMAKQKITTYKNIVDMVEMYNKGVTIYVLNRKDLSVIYADLQKHLFSWKDFLNGGVNYYKAPVDDLIAMDEFAQCIFNEIRFDVTPQEAGFGFIHAMTSRGFGSIGSGLFKMAKAEIPQEGDVDNGPKRESFIPYFRKSKING